MHHKIMDDLIQNLSFETYLLPNTGNDNNSIFAIETLDSTAIQLVYSGRFLAFYPDISHDTGSLPGFLG
jgi:hypothetical protein